MAGRFLRVSCKDCGSEAIIFDRPRPQLHVLFVDRLLQCRQAV